MTVIACFKREIYRRSKGEIPSQRHLFLLISRQGTPGKDHARTKILCTFFLSLTVHQLHRTRARKTRRVYHNNMQYDQGRGG